jgi:hypothetical protein
MSNNNVKFKMILRSNVKFNNKDLSKLSNTDKQAFIKVMEYLEIYNEDIPYKTMMPYVDEPRILLMKLKEYYID